MEGVLRGGGSWVFVFEGALGGARGDLSLPNHMIRVPRVYDDHMLSVAMLAQVFEPKLRTLFSQSLRRISQKTTLPPYRLQNERSHVKDGVQ